MLKPIMTPNTGVIPFLNGISHMETMQKILGKDNILGGVAAISALIKEPGIIIHNSPMQMLKFGELNNQISDRVEFHKAMIQA